MQCSRHQLNFTCGGYRLLSNWCLGLFSSPSPTCFLLRFAVCKHCFLQYNKDDYAIRLHQMCFLNTLNWIITWDDSFFSNILCDHTELSSHTLPGESEECEILVSHLFNCLKTYWQVIYYGAHCWQYLLFFWELWEFSVYKSQQFLGSHFWVLPLTIGIVLLYKNGICIWYMSTVWVVLQKTNRKHLINLQNQWNHRIVSQSTWTVSQIKMSDSITGVLTLHIEFRLLSATAMSSVRLRNLYS